MYSLTITEEALSDISEATIYYRDIMDGLQIRFRKAIEERFSDIKRHPQHYGFFSLHHAKTYRSVLLKKFPYQIIYEIRNDEVIVLGVVHTKRRPNTTLKRLRKRP